ncbi:hypothetical protein JCM18899A_48020 [Nocardioides sp. AN3]
MRLRAIAVPLVVTLLVAVALVATLGVSRLENGALAQPGAHASASPSASPSNQLSPQASTPPSAQAGAGPGQPGHVVMALGDSVPSGKACDCSPFPQTYGTLLAKHTGTRVSVDNRAVSGLQTSDVVAQLRTPDIQAAVRRADIFLVTIGANDFGDHHDQVVTGECEAGNTDCVSDELETMRADLASVLATIRSLRRGKPTTMLVTGYWNVFEDGDVARQAYGDDGLQASLQLTRRANGVIKAVSTAAGARYVDLFTPFEQSGRDVTALMAPDGDHPDAAGHQLIAGTLLSAGLPRV